MAKGKYHDWLTEDGLRRVEGWARDGLSDKQICINIGITQETFYQWSKTYPSFSEAVKKLSNEVNYVMGVENFQPESDILIDMHDVNVGWDDHMVLKNLNWTLKRGEHWLIRGPNGSGKTTLLELITGDNMQVFAAIDDDAHKLVLVGKTAQGSSFESELFYR